MGNGIGLTHHGLDEATFLRGVKEPLLIFEGRIAVKLDIHVKADGCAYIWVASRLRALPFTTTIDPHIVERDAHAFGEGANLGHETTGEAGGEIGHRQRRGALATVKPMLSTGGIITGPKGGFSRRVRAAIENASKSSSSIGR